MGTKKPSFEADVLLPVAEHTARVCAVFVAAPNLPPPGHYQVARDFVESTCRGRVLVSIVENPLASTVLRPVWPRRKPRRTWESGVGLNLQAVFVGLVLRTWDRLGPVLWSQTTLTGLPVPTAAAWCGARCVAIVQPMSAAKGAA